MSSPSPSAVRVVVAGLLAALLAAAGCQWRERESAPELCSGLHALRLSRVYLVGEGALSCAGITTKTAPEALSKLLDGKDEPSLVRVLRGEKGAALAVASDVNGRGLRGSLGRMITPAGLRAVALGPQLAVYAPNDSGELSLKERDALAYVARALLRGAREPSLSSFPPALRRVERVEVMVLLRERGEARLWRSAKGTSVARGLLTAARVARDRWRERESAMGGPLPQRLLDLDVEVSALVEDGSLLSTQQAFVDRAVTGEYGIGFEYRSGWHYVLPSDMQKRGSGSAYRALLWLLKEQGLNPATLAQSAMRVYRLTNRPLGLSRAPLSGLNDPG